MRFILAVFTILICAGARAEVTHHLFRKIAVFPIADANFSTSEDAWWQMRETLTKEQRFLVASRRFMINRGAFQPRRALKPADAIILGKILDAEALMVTFLEDRNLKTLVYNGEDGSTLWESNLELHPAVPVADQLIRASNKLVQDFLLAIPYQGFQIVDPVAGRAIYEVDGQKRAWIFHGTNSGLDVGDEVQWIVVSGEAGRPFLTSPMSVQVVAEGKIITIKGNQAEVEIEKMRSENDLQENSLVRFPREIAKLKAQYGNDDKGSALMSEYLSSEMKPPSELKGGHHSTATALAFLGNIAMIVLLAF
jgi:hypothetical protein